MSLLEDVNQHITSTYDLIERINRISTEETKRKPFPFSLDVVSMYTNIPVPEAINLVIDKPGLLATDIEQILIV